MHNIPKLSSILGAFLFIALVGPLSAKAQSAPPAAPVTQPTAEPKLISSELELVERATGHDFTSENKAYLARNGSDAGFSSAIWHRYRARRNAGIGLTALGGALEGVALALGLFVVITEGMGQPAYNCGPDGKSLCDVDHSPPTGIRVAGWTLIGVGTATLVSGVVLLTNGSKGNRRISRAHGRGWKPEPRRLSFGGVLPSLDPSAKTAGLGLQFSF